MFIGRLVCPTENGGLGHSGDAKCTSSQGLENLGMQGSAGDAANCLNTAEQAWVLGAIPTQT